MSVCALLASPLAARADGQVKRLLDRATSLESRGRCDQAVEVYKQVLLSAPSHPGALGGVIGCEAREGRTSEAKRYLIRLEQAHSGHRSIGRLKHLTRLGARFDQLLNRARRKVQQGAVAEGISAYREAFGKFDPPVSLAREYYQTLGGTPDGWEEAKAGLERLVVRSSTKQNRLALAQHLTYREKTRRAGIAELEQLAELPSVRKVATRAWRDALLWLNARVGDVSRYNRFLAKNQDERVQKRLATLRRIAPPEHTLEDGFEAIERADVKQAERIFEGARKSKPNSPEAMVGLAMLAMKQEQFSKAKELLEVVRSRAPDKPEMWQQSLQSASFWSAMVGAKGAAKKGEVAEARRRYLEAARLSPTEAHHAKASLGQLALSSGDHFDAQRFFGAALSADPSNVSALQGMVRVHLEQSQGERAIEYNRRLAKLSKKDALPPGRIESEILRTRASRARLDGRISEAKELLDVAREADPTNVWALHDLAYLHLEARDFDSASSVVDKLFESDSANLTEVKTLQARVLLERGEFEHALEIVRSIRPEEETEDLVLLRRRVSVQVEVEQLVAQGRAGEVGQARRGLLRLERHANESSELAAVVAMGWAELSEYPRATQLLNRAAAVHGEPSPGLRLQLASILLRAGDEERLNVVLSELSNDPRLTAVEREDLSRLRIAASVRSADVLRESGDLRGAFARLAPLLREYPDENSVRLCLGRLFQGASRHEDAQVVFDKVLSEDAENLGAREGAINAALALSDRSRASDLVDEGITLNGNTARMHLVAARFYVQTGSDGAAMDHLSKARMLGEASGAGGALLSAGGDDEEVLRAAFEVFGGATKEKKGTRQSNVLLEEITREEEQIRARHGSVVTGDLMVRQRDGEEILGQLTEAKIPLLAVVPFGYSVRLRLQAVPTFLDAGQSDFGPNIAQRFGSVGATPIAGANPQSLSVSGVGIVTGIEWGDFTLDVGHSPLGFEVENVIGKASYRGRAGRVGFAFEASREPVTDSLLSYSGTIDPASGQIHGGVIRQGGRLDLSVDVADGVYYLWVGGYNLPGVNVAENNQAIGSIGAEWRLLPRSEGKVAVGANVLGMGYERNLSQFTLGHGGYFSPQVFIRAGVPFTWTNREGDLQWRAVVDPGVNWFRTDQINYFPSFPELNQSRAAIEGAELAYAAQSIGSFSLNAIGEVDYALSANFRIGARLDVHTAQDYTEYTGGVFVRQVFGSSPRVETPTLGDWGMLATAQ
ncbi:MAG: cellulose synthase subunit BcsC-related outer membrane protein [Myxococcota bacterium]